MSNPSKAKGTAFETALVWHLRAGGFFAERLSLAGNQDEGDIAARRMDNDVAPYIIEAKATKGFTPAEWVKQAKVEAQNYAKHRGIDVPHWVVVAKARNKPITEAYVITTLAEWIAQRS